MQDPHEEESLLPPDEEGPGLPPLLPLALDPSPLPLPVICSAPGALCLGPGFGGLCGFLGVNTMRHQMTPSTAARVWRLALRHATLHNNVGQQATVCAIVGALFSVHNCMQAPAGSRGDDDARWRTLTDWSPPSEILNWTVVGMWPVAPAFWITWYAVTCAPSLDLVSAQYHPKTHQLPSKISRVLREVSGQYERGKSPTSSKGGRFVAAAPALCGAYLHDVGGE